MFPIIKWAGGKRQLLPELKKRIPQTYKNYYEPFMGSGALFFDLAPQKAVLNDINAELINLYLSVRNELDLLLGIAAKYQTEFNNLHDGKERAEYFYARRADYNKHINNQEMLDVNDAALLLFLNKACYNGLYRVNSSGLFNTPYGKREKLNLFDNENMQKCSAALRHATLKLEDFESACRNARKGDFVYFDSPYYDTFDTYQAGGFPAEEHERLAALFKKLSTRGVYCMLSNSDTDFIKSLYSDYSISIVPVKRMINCDGKKRTGTEVIVTNY